MTQHQRFMTYARLEKAYRRILARRMPARQRRRKLQTRNQRIIEAIGVSVLSGQGRSDSLAPLRRVTLEDWPQARPARLPFPALERILA